MTYGFLIGGVPTYGQNLKRLRVGRLTQEQLAAKGQRSRQANLPSYENDHKFPSAKLVERHAKLLDVGTEDLLLGVVTVYDRIRWPHLSEAQREGVLGTVSAMGPKQVTALIQAHSDKVAALLAEATPQSNRESKAGSQGKAGRTDRGKKSA